MPSPHAIAAILLTIAMFVMFAQGRVRIEVVCLVLISVLALGFYFFPLETPNGPTGMQIAFGGFGHEALVTICCLMILGRGLVTTGSLEPATLLLSRLWAFNRSMGLLLTILVCAGLSMFINDTPVLVLTMPILLSLAAQTGYPASKTLMPVNFAILIGGMMTTIGTSTNLLVVSIARDMGLAPINVFDFTDVAFIGLIVAVPYLWLVMPRLLPSYGFVASESQRQFWGSLHIEAGSSSIGQTLDELRSRLGPAARVYDISRGFQQQRVRDPDARLREGDVVQVEGSVQALRQAGDRAKVSLTEPTVLKSLSTEASQDQILAEVVVGADSGLVGETVRSARIADRYGAAVIGLYRPDRTFYHEPLKTADEHLEVGDVLLIQGPPERLKELQVKEGTMVLEGAAEVPRRALAPVALAIVAAVVVSAALQIVPIAVGSLAGTIAMIATGCVKFDRVGRALSGEVIVLVAASIALGRALLETGAAAWLGQGLSVALDPLPPAGVLAAIMAFAALLTNFSSNTAAAAVTTPIAVSVALQTGVPAEPMVLAVLFGCNLCYATPVAYQTNILIMSAAGYQFRDFVRAGLPLVILMIVTLSLALVFKYQL